MADWKMSASELMALLRRLHAACRTEDGVIFTASAADDRDFDLGLSREQALTGVLLELMASDYVKSMDATKPPPGVQHVFLGQHPHRPVDIYIKLVERDATWILSFKEDLE